MCLLLLTFSLFYFSSAKSLHPKKAGGTTKTTSTPTATSTPRPRSKDAGAAAQSDGRDTRTNRKSDAPASSSVTQKTSTETPSQPRDLKLLPLSSDSKPASSKASSNETEKPQATSASPPNTSAAGEETQKGMAPEPTVQSPQISTAAEDTSFTEGKTDSRYQREKQGRTGAEGGEEEKKKGETESAAQDSPRYLLRMW